MRNYFNICLFLILSGLVIPHTNYSQAPDWTRVLQLSTYGAQYCDYITTDANYTYMASSINGPVTFNGTDFVSIGFRDMLISKINYAGVISWIKQIDAQTNGSIYANTMKVDANGNIYLAGIFSGQSTIGGSTITSGTLYNAFIAKFDAAGNGIWATPFFSIGNGKSKMSIDVNGNIYLISRSRTLMKFNSYGESQWEQTYPDKTLLAIAISGSDLFLGGALQSGTTNFGSIALTSLGGYNTGYLVKADLDGVFSSSMVVGGSTSGDGSSISDIVLDNSGNLILTGGYTKDLLLGTITIANTAQSYYTYIAKCDNNLAFVWASSSSGFSNPAREMLNYRIFTDDLNNIYEYGMLSTLFTYGSVAVSPINGQFLVKFDQNGNATNSLPFQSTTLYKTYVAPNGKILIGGSVNTVGATSYGNFYISQYSNNMSLEWEKLSSNSLTGNAKINYVKHDAEGNTYIQARVLGYCNYFGTIINSSSYLTIISKHDISGNMQWMNSISDISPATFGSPFTIDKDNNVLTTGLFQTTMNIGNTTLTTSNTGNEGYVAKYSSAGVFLWVAKMDLGIDISTNITVASDNSGNVLVSGQVNPSNYLVKFDASGNRLWANIFPMESYYFSLISTDANNNIYLTSEIHLSSGSGSATIGSVVLTQSLNDGATALVKFDQDGNALWAKTYGGVMGASYSDGWACDIKTDAAGNCYLWGWCTNNATFGTFTLINPFATNQNYSYFLAKINTLGDVLWAKAVYETKTGFNYGDLLDLDKNGNVYVGGHFKDKINIDGNEYSPEGTNDFFTAKFSDEGLFQWIKTIPSSSNIITAISTNDDNVISIAGIPGTNSMLGSFPIERKGGSNCIVATLGTLHSNYHFVPVWYPGYGMDHMNLYALTATLDGTPLQPGDEIGIFDGDVCVGMGTLTQVLTGSTYLSMVVSKDDPDTPSKDGYTPGNTISFKVWDSGAGKEVSNAQADYVSGSGIFSVGGTASFNLNAVTSITQDISLTAGWNIMSFAGEPDNMSLSSIVNSLKVAGTLVKIQDEKGSAIEQLPAPIGWVDNIGLMKVSEGYKIKVSANTTLSVTGKPVTLPYDIDLSTGWNIMGYPSMSSQAAMAAFQSMINAGTLLKVQDEKGSAIEQLPAPIGWVDNIHSLAPGEGYKIKVSAATSITINNSGKGEYENTEFVTLLKPSHFKPAYTGNGFDHMNIYLKEATIGGAGLQPGDEIGVFDGGVCVGSVVVEDPDSEYIMVTASFDDPTTKETDGFIAGHNFTLKLWDRQTGVESNTKDEQYEKGSGNLFERLGTSVLMADFDPMSNISFGYAYPNPSTEKTTFTFEVAGETDVRLEIFNMRGDLIKVLVDRQMPGGIHHIEWDNRSANGARASSGIYFYKLMLNNFAQTKQLIIH